MLNPDFSLELLQAAETAGLNASTPPQQELLDGWLIRLSPGKAKRSRCINALAQGRLPLVDMLARCQHAFEQAGLPLVVRLTPFSQPTDLDQQLAALGWSFFDDTRVMIKPDLTTLPAVELPAGCRLQKASHAEYALAVGQMRGSSSTEIAAHAERMREAPVRYEGMLMMSADNELLACGQFAREAGLVGLYDIFTVPTYRRQGLGERLCVSLLSLAREQGAQSAYLQVSADNHAARSIYRRLGFVDGYSYHYRTPDLASVY